MKYTTILQFARTLRKNQTKAEKIFWGKVRNRRFLGRKFTRQFIVQHQDIQGNKKFFIADFHCHENRLIVEIDGGIHENQLDYDQVRDEILVNMGFKVIRFKNEEVLENWNKVERILEKALNSS